ncbi:MAG TPA: xanthine dehydrogenase family protein molybdopterin-binding subunit [Acidimicrobiales bacterium]|nr:xanthine dehydrogenase family protein molybdopterin-binding subunit [Acidimicrobiales bacterium]
MIEAASNLVGTSVPRVEDHALLTVGGTYIPDLDLPGAAHVTFVRATMAHARIRSLRIESARAAPGVVAVMIARDLTDLAPAPPLMPMMNQGMCRPFLADGVVRFAGEAVAVVVAETPEQGADAAELVEVEYDPLPVLIDPQQATLDEVLLFPAATTNTVSAMDDVPRDDLFSDCEVVVEARLVNNRMAVAPIEPRACASRWDGDRLTQWSATQAVHNTRGWIAAPLGVAPDKVRVVVPDMGGGFGGKLGNYPEDVMVAWLARRLGRPMRWVESRTEHMSNFAHARAQIHRVAMGGTRDGRIIAYRLDVLQDCGAYPSNFGGMMPLRTRMMASGCYAISAIEYRYRTVVTNTTPVGAFRGAGRPEAAAAIERVIDLFASEIGLDPVEVRRRNFVSPDAFPFETATGASYDSGEYEAALDRALAAADYPALRAEQARRRAEGDHVLLGIGIASYVESSNPGAAAEYGAIEIQPDGRACIRTGSSPHGQGHHTTFGMIASDITGIPLDRIDFLFGDTAAIPRGGGTGGSRSVQVGGSAVKVAADRLVEVARARASDVLEASIDDIVLDRPSGSFHVVGAPARGVTWSELAAAPSDPLGVEVDFTPDGATFPFGAHVAVVEVDADTGRVTLRRIVAVDDAGFVVNPLLLEGQIHGGIASGVAQALTEEIGYDADGNLLTGNFADYGIISAAELPDFELVAMATPSPRNPLGAKGVGESGTIGATPAVQNAVIDALAHLGVRHLDLPLTAQRVWRTLVEARGRAGRT